MVSNEDIRLRAPSLVAETERKTMARLWAGQHKSADEVGIWATMMEPHLRDPCRGTLERRHLAKGESSLSLELVAAREAITRCGLEPRDIDLVIGTSFLPDQIGIGNATFLCKHLGLRAAAWNLESACRGTMVPPRLSLGRCRLARASWPRRRGTRRRSAAHFATISMSMLVGHRGS